MADERTEFDEPGRYKNVRASSLKSGRIGSSGGRAARTFHCHFSGVTVAQGGSGRAASAVDYLAGEHDFDGRDDLEHLAGDTDRVRDALAAVDAAAKWRKGRTAERVAIKAEIELPADSTREQRAAVANALVAMWKRRGHEAVAAVHAKDVVQPHIHVLVTARPVELTRYGWVVDRDPARVPLRGRAATRACRARVAALINGHCRPAVRFHPGRLRDTGIVRPAKTRLPEAEYHRQTRGDDSRARQINASIDAGIYDEVHTARAEWSSAAAADQIRRHQERATEQAARAKLRGARADLRAADAELRAAEADLRAARLVAGRAVDRLVIRDWQQRYEQLETTVAAERERPDAQPPTEKQRSTAADLANRLQVELPVGWDATVGSAGAANRLLLALKSERAARENAEAERDDARADVVLIASRSDEALEDARAARELAERERADVTLAASKPPQVVEVEITVERVPDAVQRELERLQQAVARLTPGAKPVALPPPPVAPVVIPTSTPVPSLEPATASMPVLRLRRSGPGYTMRALQMREEIRRMPSGHLLAQESAQVAAIEELWRGKKSLSAENRSIQEEIQNVIGQLRQEISSRPEINSPTPGKISEDRLRKKLDKYTSKSSEI